ncbi:hypothetical protein OJ997_09985 [Solirubrobacter phytolaccae]|uniref:Uncharacterized protein n=1 Tax=Solirubrobacter phytolaccae TaxID=1404360 RepID=A0A9X3SAU2_9ACTN|nr:hypothetical protein [Solirubrobacter phytolaccae]MDA0180620.1 hypothetical protein [Solirubrobacter phytolaccae]
MPDWDAFELRYDIHGRCAVRIGGGARVLTRHVEPLPLTAPWCVEARCAGAIGWLLADRAPENPERERARLQREVERRTARVLAQRLEQLTALDAELLERLTHRLRTDVTTLQAVADGALLGAFGAAEEAEITAQVTATAAEAQRRLTAAREVMGVLAPVKPRAPEAIAATLRAELEGAGREATVTVDAEEEPFTLVPGPGWAACARRLAADEQLTAFTITPDEHGWRVHADGSLTSAAHLVVAAGGFADTDLVLPPTAPAS